MLMKIEGATLLAIDEKVSKKTGLVYKVGLFFKGTETITLMLPTGATPQCNKVYSLECDYSIKWKQIKLLSLK